jgi:shikimate dehydrogenase
MNMPRKFAVLGNPIKHSLSPRLHALFAQQTGLQIEYSKQCVEPAHFRDHVKQFFAAGGCGLNITLPFKEQAYALADPRISDRARAAGSANTLWQENGEIHACNTDGVGLVNDMLRQHITLHDSRILLIGAGGATRGVMPALLQAGCAHLHIVNRSEDKAHALAAQAAALPGPQAQVTASAFSALQGTWDIIVNATSSSLSARHCPCPTTCFAPTAWPTICFIPQTATRRFCNRRATAAPAKPQTAWACWSTRAPRAFASGTRLSPTRRRFSQRCAWN